MYDTVNFSLDAADYNNRQYFQIASKVLQNVKHTYELDTSNQTITGNINNYKVTVKPHEVYLAGSLCKYHFGNNLQTLNNYEAGLAMEKLADELKLPIKRARVVRLDLGYNIITKEPADTYFPYLGDAPYYFRIPCDSTLYYKNKSRTMCFYAKDKELKQKGQPIDEEFQGKHILRYELRLLKNVKGYFRRKVYGHYLSDSAFFQNAACQWWGEFMKIDLLNDTVANTPVYNSTALFEKALVFKGIESMGGMEQIFQIVANAKTEGLFKSPNHYQNLKRKLRKLSQYPDFTETSYKAREIEWGVGYAAGNFMGLP